MGFVVFGGFRVCVKQVDKDAGLLRLENVGVLFGSNW